MNISPGRSKEQHTLAEDAPPILPTCWDGERKELKPSEAPRHTTLGWD